MSSYRFQLRDYHAVKNADVKLNGITVISGLNGTGKSTIARWLYYVVYVLCNYDRMVEENAQNRFLSFIKRLHYSTPIIGNSSQNHNLYSIYRDLRQTSNFYLSDMKDVVEKVISIVTESLIESVANQSETASLRRYEEFFKIDANSYDSFDEFLIKVRESIYSDYYIILDEESDKLSHHTLKNFKANLISRLDLDVDGPGNFEIEFSEDGVDLFGDNGFGTPLNLRNVIYVNTQNLGKSISLFADSDMERMLSDKRNDVIQDSASNIAKLISHLIHGDIKVKKGNNEIIPDSEFNFVSDSGATFNLRGAATGVISFSYLLQLLKNGWIDENTLFIIDEPECHLHPQWIVEYAHMLVRINKYIGAKIVISSHNPDMVSAIQAISSHEGTLDNLNFYLAEPSTETKGQYEFRCLGTEYSEIFDAFNVSIDRINAFLPEE